MIGKRRSSIINLIMASSALFIIFGLISLHSRHVMESITQENWSLLQTKRLKHLDETCAKLGRMKGEITHEVLLHLLVDEKNKVLYCYVPKVACTSWKWILLWMREDLKYNEYISNKAVHLRPMINLAYLSSLGKDTEEIMKSYKKVLWVRDPFSRVLSAFKNKIEKDDPSSGFSFRIRTGREIEGMRGRVFNERRNISFPEFIRYITMTPKERLSDNQKNEHWRPIVDLCDPCLVKYDFVGRFETLKLEADEALAFMGPPELVGKLPAPEGGTTSNSRLDEYFKRLTSAEKVAFFKAYLEDYLLFQYDFFDHELPTATAADFVTLKQ